MIFARSEKARHFPSTPLDTTMSWIKNGSMSLLTAACSWTSVAANASDSPLVDTTSGQIVGHRAPNRTETFEFLGVKYAAAPVGDLRFAPPGRHSPSEGTVYEASDWNAYA